MARPTKLELLQRFFPELGQPGSRGDKEAAVRVNTMAVEAILADQIQLYDQGLRQYGPGVLALRLHRRATSSDYLTVDDLQQDLSSARRADDDATAGFLSELVESIGDHNSDKAALVLLIDNSSAQVFPIDRDYPARSVQSLLEEFAA